jgi:hypothetical protein
VKPSDSEAGSPQPKSRTFFVRDLLEAFRRRERAPFARGSLLPESCAFFVGTSVIFQAFAAATL